MSELSESELLLLEEELLDDELEQLQFVPQEQLLESSLDESLDDEPLCCFDFFGDFSFFLGDSRVSVAEFSFV